MHIGSSKILDQFLRLAISVSCLPFVIVDEAQAIRGYMRSTEDSSAVDKQRLYPPGKEGTPVVAMESARVLCCDCWLDNFGKTIIVVKQPESASHVMFGYYAPVIRCYVKENQIMKPGQVIGTYGHPPFIREKDASTLTGRVDARFVYGLPGKPATAINSGIVISASWYGGYGKTICIKQDNGSAHMYVHLGKYLVQTGQHVQQGQPIGIFGTNHLAGTTRFLRHHFLENKRDDESILLGKVY